MLRERTQPLVIVALLPMVIAPEIMEPVPIQILSPNMGIPTEFAEWPMPIVVLCDKLTLLPIVVGPI